MTMASGEKVRFWTAQIGFWVLSSRFYLQMGLSGSGDRANR